MYLNSRIYNEYAYLLFPSNHVFRPIGLIVSHRMRFYVNATYIF